MSMTQKLSKITYQFKSGLAASVLAISLVAIDLNPIQAAPVPESFADLAEQVSPAVVSITTTSTVEQPVGGNPIVPPGSPFEDFFRDFMERNGQGGRPRQPRTSTALGSGFVISADGYIVTNNHVIDGADEIRVKFNDDRELEAKLIGRDKKVDIALLKVEADGDLPFVPFGDSDLARVGDWVMAIGSPLGQTFSVSAGIVSARNRELNSAYDDFIQTDAAINRGNSGGPLFNMAGEVVGVNTAILSPNGGSIGIGFSMSSNVVKSVVDQLQEFGETRRGWLGVQIQNVTEDIAETLNYEGTKGALVSDVPADGPAAKAGIQTEDIIVEFDGEKVEDTRDLVKLVGTTAVGKEVDIQVFRDGELETVNVTLGLLDDNTGEGGGSSKPMHKEDEFQGMKLSSLTDELRAQFNIEAEVEGVLILDLQGNSKAAEMGLQPGDLIVEAGQVAVKTPDELDAQFAKTKEEGREKILLLIQRQGAPRFVALELEE